MSVEKTSQQWYDELRKTSNITIMDPDGWDRTNYKYSFTEELITKEKFDERLSRSTVSGNINEMIKS
jgi:hypothetical protein